jgi:hypothetical protein
MVREYGIDRGHKDLYASQAEWQSQYGLGVMNNEGISKNVLETTKHFRLSVN